MAIGEHSPKPANARRSADLEAWRALSNATSRDVAVQAAGIVMACMVGEVIVGAATGHGLGSDHHYAYVNARVTNRWLLHMWPAIDARTRFTSPPHLALYFALGWTQASTTWQWPATETWIALLSGPAPEHWLPRLHYHQCWRLYQPHDPATLQGVRQAIEDGRHDGELVGYADAFAEVLLDAGADETKPS